MATGPAGISAVAPPKFYYVAIDGSSAVDSAVFCALLEKHAGWRNLYKTFLTPAAGDPNRLDDPRHPFLPICIFKQDGREIAVVSPGGRDAKGNDPFWATYPGKDPATGTPDPVGLRDWGGGLVTCGRHTAAEESAKYVSQLVLRPQVEVITPGAAGAPGIIRQLPEGSPTSGAQIFAADLLYVSSHGWLGGFAGGFLIGGWTGASPSPANDPYNPHHYYFSVGRYAAAGSGFAGPKWIVLAQCSTVNSATWPLWARVLAKSSPHVRGILAYEEASPLPAGAATIARQFFGHLDSKKTFLEAWKAANPGQHWAAIVHKDALQDRLDRWPTFTDFADVTTSATTSNYLGFLAGAPRGERIFDAPPPFELVLERVRPGTSTIRITSANLDDLEAAEYRVGRTYRVTIRAPAGESIVKASLRWIHIRPTNPYKPSIDELFETVKAPAHSAMVGIVPRAKELEIRPTTPTQTEVVFELTTGATLINPKIEAHHSYFWPSIELVTDKATRRYDFKTTGLLYYGECGC